LMRFRSAVLIGTLLAYCRRADFGFLRLRWLLPILRRRTLPVPVT